MGSSESQQNNGRMVLQNQWQSYLKMLQKDKPSNIQPFTSSQMMNLQELFKNLDKKNLNSIQIKDFDQILQLRSHPFFVRIKQIFQQQMKKIKAKRVNFQLFLFLLSVFHVKTPPENKVKYLFRLYDYDKNLRIDSIDLMRIYKITYKMPYLQQDDYSRLVTQTLIKYGSKGEIKLQNIMQLVPIDQIKQIMSFKFDQNFR